MSFSRLAYDIQAYKQNLAESSSPGTRQLKPYAHTRDDACFSSTPEMWLKAGAFYRNYENNDLVDIESDLHNLIRKNSKYSKDKYPYVQREYTKIPKNDSCNGKLQRSYPRLEAPRWNREQTTDHLVFENLCLNPQQLNRIRSNFYIGSLTRLYNGDNYVPNIPNPLSQTGALPPQIGAPKPRMNCNCEFNEKQ